MHWRPSWSPTRLPPEWGLVKADLSDVVGSICYPRSWKLIERRVSAAAAAAFSKASRGQDLVPHWSVPREMTVSSRLLRHTAFPAARTPRRSLKRKFVKTSSASVLEWYSGNGDPSHPKSAGCTDSCRTPHLGRHGRDDMTPRMVFNCGLQVPWQQVAQESVQRKSLERTFVHCARRMHRNMRALPSSRFMVHESPRPRCTSQESHSVVKCAPDTYKRDSRGSLAEQHRSRQCRLTNSGQIVCRGETLGYVALSAKPHQAERWSASLLGRIDRSEEQQRRDVASAVRR